MLALAPVLDRHPRGEAASLNGMDRQTLFDWVHRYNTGGIEGLKSRKAPGAEPALLTLLGAPGEALGYDRLLKSTP